MGFFDFCVIAVLRSFSAQHCQACLKSVRNRSAQSYHGFAICPLQASADVEYAALAVVVLDGVRVS